MGLLDKLRRQRRIQDQAHALYGQAMAQARQPVFYAELGVPDTLDGRFDLLVLHAFLLLRRLKRGGAEAERLSQTFFDLMFSDMDRTLREMGVGDQSVGKRIKQMLQAFYGRMRAYEEALAAPVGLPLALKRNLYRDGAVASETLTRLAAYVEAEAARLDAEPLTTLLGGEAGFAVPPSVQLGTDIR